MIHDKYWLLLSMTGVGIAWASILSMPYAILSGSLPPARTGVYMGIFNFFIVIPEILASLGFGWVMLHLLGNDRLAAVVAGGAFLVLAAILVLRVHDAAAPSAKPRHDEPARRLAAARVRRPGGAPALVPGRRWPLRPLAPPPPRS